jgi:hypothetical protein
MTNDTPTRPVDDLSREELYAEECKRIEEVTDASTTIQTILENAPPIEPAGSHIDQRNERVKAQLNRLQTLLTTLEQLHNELQRR